MLEIISICILGPEDDSTADDDQVYDLPLNISQKPPLEALDMFKQGVVDSNDVQPIRVTHDRADIL